MPEQATLPPAATVTGPGVYTMSTEAYHRDPVPGGSLSSTGLRKLLKPSCPALFQHWRENGDEPKPAWDKGHAAHKLNLGEGPELVLVDRPRWDTKEVKAQLADIRERGAVPLKRPDWDEVHGMAAALKAHPWAGQLFKPGTGEPEQVLIWNERTAWTDEQMVTHHALVPCRARVDWLRNSPAPGRRYLLPDYKSTGAKYGASPEKIGRAMADWGYYIQLRFYVRGLLALAAAGAIDIGDTGEAVGLLVVQETSAPYLVTVAEPDRDAVRLAEMRIGEALSIYARCTATGRWEGYADDVIKAELPPWETRELQGQVW